jgi:tRNA 2-thiouridine synthesizing protein A
MYQLDLSGLNCPMPVLHTKKFMATIVSGEIVSITTTDPDSSTDLQIFCEKTKNILINQIIENSIIITTIQKR